MKGIININKPQNFTSHDCVAIVRRLVGIKRVGHTGTLDPMATGVLPVCIGPATRIMEYLDEDRKEYRCTMKLGLYTDTCDIWGEILEKKETDHLTEEAIQSAFVPFSGEIDQIPPIYSARKVKGRKLYEYARAGEEVEIRPRKITVHRLDVEKIRGDEITFFMACSKGTYLRSICRDVGNALGVGGTMTALTRLGSGAFKIEDAVNLEVLRQMTTEEIKEKFLPIDFPLESFEKTQVDKERAKDFAHGKKISIGDIFSKDRIRIYYKDVFLGMAQRTEVMGEWKAHKVFHTEI